MEIWLKGSSTWFRFPIIPSEYTVSSDSGNETVTVNALGEVDLGGKRKLRAISFSSFFPKNYDTYCSYRNLTDPKRCVEIIEELRDGSPRSWFLPGLRSISHAEWKVSAGEKMMEPVTSVSRSL